MFDIKGYYEATSITEALRFLDMENSKIIAGGTDILIKNRNREAHYLGLNLVGVTRIPELKEIKIENNAIMIGAASTFTTVENNPIVKQYLPSLSQAVGTVGGPQIRNTGTIGGNICNGATSADSASTLFCLNAILGIASRDGIREMPIQEFYLGPSKVALASNELLVYIKITKENYDGFQGSYIKLAQRNAMDIATLGCSVLLKQKDNKIESLRIAFGVAGPTPVRATQAETFAHGKTLSTETIEAIGEKCLEDTNPRDSWRGSKAYRTELIQALPKRALLEMMGGKQ